MAEDDDRSLVVEVVLEAECRLVAPVAADAVVGDAAVEDPGELVRPSRLVRDADRAYYAKVTYLNALRVVIEDRRIDPGELKLLRQIERIVRLSPEFVAEARLLAFREIYLEAVADHDLTEEEEQTLAHVREELEIPSSSIQEELETLGQLKEIRDIQEGALPEALSPRPLLEGEVCHFAGIGRLIRRGGHGWVPTKDGQGHIIITNQRLLVVHQGTTSIPLAEIRVLEVHYDEDLLLIRQEGAKTPICLNTSQALRAGAILATATGG